VSFTVRPAADAGGLLLICTLQHDSKRRDFPLVFEGESTTDLVLWVSRTHGEEAEFVEVAQRCFEEIERAAQRWLPAAELRLRFD